jgi:uncharacterized protein (UPF0179 family)
MWLLQPHKLLWGALTACLLIDTWIRTLTVVKTPIRMTVDRGYALVGSLITAWEAPGDVSEQIHFSIPMAF